MSQLTQHRGGGIIIISIIVALTLTILPLPRMLELFRPEWVAMVVIYWCMAVPQRFGVGFAWLIGLLLDVVRDSLLGQYALGLALIAFLVLHIHQRLRVFPLWQQALTIALLIIVQYMIVFWIKGITGESTSIWNMLLPAFTTLLFWPPVYLLMRQLRRHFQVS